MNELRTELTDMLTDFVAETAAQAICCNCVLNKEEADTGTTVCPCDFDLFSCEFCNYDLVNEIDAAAERLIEVLPEPPEDWNA